MFLVCFFLLSQKTWAVSDADYITKIIPGSLFIVKSDIVLPANTNWYVFESKEFGNICKFFYRKYSQDRVLTDGYKLSVFAVDYRTGNDPHVLITLRSEKTGWMPILTCDYRKADGYNFLEPIQIGELRRILNGVFDM